MKTLLPPSIANTVHTLEPQMKITYPTQTQRKKRFAKIRQVIKKDSGV